MGADAIAVAENPYGGSIVKPGLLRHQALNTMENPNTVECPACGLVPPVTLKCTSCRTSLAAAVLSGAKPGPETNAQAPAQPEPPAPRAEPDVPAGATGDRPPPTSAGPPPSASSDGPRPATWLSRVFWLLRPDLPDPPPGKPSCDWSLKPIGAKVSARFVDWPGMCICCGCRLDISGLAGAREGPKGLRILRAELGAELKLYCSPCGEHLAYFDQRAPYSPPPGPGCLLSLASYAACLVFGIPALTFAFAAATAFTDRFPRIPPGYPIIVMVIPAYFVIKAPRRHFWRRYYLGLHDHQNKWKAEVDVELKAKLKPECAASRHALFITRDKGTTAFYGFYNRNFFTIFEALNRDRIVHS